MYINGNIIQSDSNKSTIYTFWITADKAGWISTISSVINETRTEHINNQNYDDKLASKPGTVLAFNIE